MATYEQLIEGARKADAAGDEAAARRFLELAREAKGKAAPPAADASAPAAPKQGKASGILDSFTQGVTMGFGDELTGLESAVLGKTPEGGWFDYSKPFGERYDAAVAAERGQQDRFAEEAPVTATAAEIAGALATGTGAARAGLTLAGRGAPTLLGAAGRGAAEGAAYGGLYGAGEADEGSRWRGAAQGGVMGGLTGGVLSGTLGALSKSAAGRAAKKAAPEVADLKKAAGAAYDRARAVNPAFDGFDDFAMQAYRTLPDEGYHPNLHPKVKALLDRVEELSATGTAPDLKSLETLRKLSRSAAGSLDDGERRLGKMFQNALDGYMESAAARAANPTGAPAAAGQSVPSAAQRQALSDVQAGRSLWSRAKKSEMVEEALLKAERRAASTGSGGNVENAMRQNIRAILDNPKKRRGFTADEIEAMERVVRGEPVQNLLRLVGKLSPQGNGLMMALHAGVGGGAVATGNPLLMAPAALGFGAKTLADRATGANADLLSALVRSGGKIGTVAPPVRISPGRQAVIDALAAQTGGVAGPIAP